MEEKGDRYQNNGDKQDRQFVDKKSNEFIAERENSCKAALHTLGRFHQHLRVFFFCKI
jgi:hypothetical protein